MKTKKSFWLNKEQQVEIYGEILPRNYYGETRSPHYIYFKQMIDAELIKFSTGKSKVADALKVAPLMLKDRLKAGKRTIRRRSTFGDHFQTYFKFKEKQVKDGEIKEATLDLVRRAERKMLPYWKNKFIDELDSAYKVENVKCWENEFFSYEDWYRDKYAGESMFNVLKYFNSYCKWMHDNGLCRRKVRFKDPKAKVERKARKNRLSRILTNDEVNALLSNSDIIQKVAILFGFYMAFRISDVTNLEWSRVNLDPSDPYIEFLGDDKEETYTKAPLNGVLLAVLKELKQGAKSKWVFPQKRNPGEAMNTQNLYMEKVFAAAALKKFSFKILRHTRLTLDFGNPEIPDVDVMAMRRVSMKVALEHYIHPNKDNRKRMVEKESSAMSHDVSTLVDGLKLYLLEEK